MKVLAIIPARGGSKGIPRKNVRLMNGKPLIAYAIQHAKECERITDVAVSTDDEEITVMCECCSFMIKGALESYIGRDVDGARRVEARDDKVDAAFDSLQIKLSERIKTTADTDDVLNDLMIGKYLERIGDHATNIAEWTNYVVSGTKDVSQ